MEQELVLADQLVLDRHAAWLLLWFSAVPGLSKELAH